MIELVMIGTMGFGYALMPGGGVQAPIGVLVCAVVAAAGGPETNKILLMLRTRELSYIVHIPNPLGSDVIFRSYHEQNF